MQPSPVPPSGLNRTAIVTGASKGIGLAIAERLVADGYRVVGCARTPGASASALSTLGDAAIGMDADVSSANEIQSVIDTALSRFGALDILVNNAGIYDRRSVLEVSEPDWSEILSVNLTGSFLFAQAAARAMIESRPDDERDGRIVNIASVNAIVSEADSVPYNASKAGVVSLTRSLALDLAPFGIATSCVAPGQIDTGIDPIFPTLTQDQLKRMNPLGRFGKPEEIAHTVAALCHPLGQFMNGAIVQVDGGQTVGYELG